MERKLGKLAPRHDVRTLRIESYMPELPPFPTSVDWSDGITDWLMLANDSLGDCTCAAAGHMIEAWTGNAGVLVQPSDADIIAAYSAITGYTPSDPNSDQGAVELDVLRFWKNTGIANRKIGAYASVRPMSINHVKAAVNIFGGLYIGVALPVSAESQDVWDVVDGPDSDPGSWGGHAINIIGYDDAGLVCVTWGATKRMTWAWWNKYTDEAYAVLSTDFLNSQGQTPGGFDLDSLQRDLKAVTN